MERNTATEAIANGTCVLGVEFGSTRIKMVLVDGAHTPLASGTYDWENRFEEGVWTYHLEDAWAGLQACFRALKREVAEIYGASVQTVGAIGVSGMMHGYLVFDKDATQLAPFQTWRNTTTGPAAEQLTELFQFNIPQRWNIAHLYQALLNHEPHVGNIAYMTTLAGYVHWKLTGQKVVGIGEASGIFPIDSATANYSERMIDLFDGLHEAQTQPWNLRAILPQVLVAGATAGFLTEEGARLIDPTGQLQAGIPFCPPEGDAGTGMVATNSVEARTGNVSAGTSVFAMIVLEKELSQLHPEIDVVTTPTGLPVAMAHSNNCTSDLDAWIHLFQEFATAFGIEIQQTKLFETLYRQALAGDADGGGLLVYNYLSGEPTTHLQEGRPLFVRTPESRFSLANFMRAHLFSALAALKIGMDILFEQEGVQLEEALGHGGFFKTDEVGQRIMAAALNIPVTVMGMAGEGGAWGIALLAAYMLHKQTSESLETYLADNVFAEQQRTTIAPVPDDVAGFTAFMERYKTGLVLERAAVDALK